MHPSFSRYRNGIVVSSKKEPPTINREKITIQEEIEQKNLCYELNLGGQVAKLHLR